MTPVASTWPVTVRPGPRATETGLGSPGSAGVIRHPARSMARSTTGSRAFPVSSTVRVSGVCGSVTGWPVAAYQRLRRQPEAAEARTSSPPCLGAPRRRARVYVVPLLRLPVVS